MLTYKTSVYILIIVIGIMLLLNYSFDFSVWIYFLLIFIWLVFTVIGSFHIRWNYHIKAFHSNKKTAKNEIAITFDDGPDPVFTPMVLALLEQYNAKATFFCIGKNIEAHQNLFQELIAKGHTVGNHTYSHDTRFGFFSANEVASELKKMNALVKKITGLKLKLYRPAFGVTNPRIKKAVSAIGLTTIGWTVRSLDTTTRTEKQVLERVLKKVSNGDIVLLHDTSKKSVAVLEQLLLFLQENKLQAVTVDQLLRIKAYA